MYDVSTDKNGDFISCFRVFFMHCRVMFLYFRLYVLSSSEIVQVLHGGSCGCAHVVERGGPRLVFALTTRTEETPRHSYTFYTFPFVTYVRVLFLVMQEYCSTLQYVVRRPLAAIYHIILSTVYRQRNTELLRMSRVNSSVSK